MSIDTATDDQHPPSAEEWFERLRAWEDDLRKRELELDRRADDLTARRRELARQMRLASRHRPATEDRIEHLGKQFDSLLEVLHELLDSSTRSSSGGNAAAAANEAAQDLADSDAGTGETFSPRDYEEELERLQQRIEALTEQNDELAGELAQAAMRRSLADGGDADATLTWEQRKELLYRQYESESDSESGGEPNDDLSADPVASEQSPSRQQIDEETARLEGKTSRLEEELRRRDQEIEELRGLLEHKSVIEQETAASGEGLTVGAASIAKMFDGDELVQQERTRLKELQAQWEAKFRDMEIAASIERANLARQRRELERQNAELEEQLAHLKQDLKQESIAGPQQPRKWMAKLGLSE